MPAETEFEFERDESGRWYLKKIKPTKRGANRFRVAHQAGKLRMSTKEIMALTRDT